MKRLCIALLSVAATLTTTLQARLPVAGYRGFIEGHFDVGRERGLWGDYHPYYYYGASTTHGRQFNPHLFIGGGLDVEYNPSYDRTIIAFYVDGRTDWQFGRFTPYGDLRLGINLSDGLGAYFSPTVGYRFSLCSCLALNVGVGLTLKTRRIDCYDVEIQPDGSGTIIPLGRKTQTESLFALRLSLELNK